MPPRIGAAGGMHPNGRQLASAEPFAERLMLKSSWLPLLVALAAATVASGCGSSHGPSSVKVAPAPPPPAAVQPAPPVAAPPPADPVAVLIDTSQKHFATGQRELQIGHLQRAREEFNRALEVLLESPYGARSEPRIREQFDRLVDRISAYEITALAEGDGFSEKPTEPATIDELLSLSVFDTPAPTAAVAQAVRSDLKATSHDIPIPLNDRVLSYVELFQGRLRAFIEEGLTRGSKYLGMIQDVFRAEGLPLDLAYVPLIESAFKPNALSRAQARGVWQFVRSTAKENGLRQDWYVDERSDPEKATRAAARYLKTLNSMFDGDWHLALASYNGGPGRVQRAMKRSGIDDFWALSASKKKFLPRETREYVPMILAAIVIARNPAQYGFDVGPPEAFDYETVKLPGPLDLRHVAEWTGQPIDAIQTLNPELRRWTTPVRASGYELKVPRGAASSLEARLAETDPAERASLNWYTVKRGETLTSIARKLSVKRTDLAEANYVSVKSRVLPGQRLIIPRAPTTLLAAQPSRPVPLAESHQVASAETLAIESPDAKERPETARLVYRVKRGDTLTSIANLFKTSVASLRRWNGLRTNRIAIGDRLTIFRGASASASTR
jgi:membrane-bound lytic murein transglycosylase D